jgi:hypothetical protein
MKHGMKPDMKHLVLVLLSFVSSGVAAAMPELPPDDAAIAAIDLTTSAGVAAVGGAWRYSDVEIVAADFRAPDAGGQPTGAPVGTYDYRPHAGAAD